jgi:phospholipase D1/2
MKTNNHAVNSAPRLLQPGRNCWQIARADRFSMLVDAEVYFRTLRQAILRARHSVYILSWDIDSRVLLVPEGANDGYPEQFGDFLHAVAEECPDVHIRILNWNFAMLYALERNWPINRLGWGKHRRVRFELDAQHPVGASHHQKVVVIDDALAFVGGLDITRCRWDTPDHACKSTLRRDSNGNDYDPFHDVQAMVQGEAARALGELARTRWERATGKRPRAPGKEATRNLWPRDIAPDLTAVDIGIARTEPACNGRNGVYEVRQLHLDAIAAARKRLFFENQYVTSDLICKALAERLGEEQPPEVMIVTPRNQSGWLEQATMGVLRTRVHKRLKDADRFGRYRMYCAHLPGLKETSCLNVHSKVFAVDDDVLAIGSANLSNRSMSLDTECKLVIEAHGERRDEIRAAIARMRNRLLAEHLDTEPEIVQRELEQRDSLHETVEALKSEERTLREFEPETNPELDALIPEQAAFDPEKPIDADELVEQFVPPDINRPVPARLIVTGLLAVILVVLACAWRWTPLGDYVNLASMVKLAQSLQALPFTPVAVVIGYVVAGLLMVPVTLLIGVTGLVFGPLAGGIYAIAGTTLSALVTYAIGRYLGKDGVQKYIGTRMGRISRRLAKQGIVAMFVTRLLPVAPFTMVNILAGALQIRTRDYLIGTILGMLPGIIITVTFAHHLAEAVRHPTIGGILLMVGLAALLIVLAIGLQRVFQRRSNAAAEAAQ